mmetsp:Transcript_39766/g.81828  ORF Transcript_39766/g.81828 Transcript_39766/m.81828 type:complete len:253 (-) Transcript_39766:1370-2128(-)
MAATGSTYSALLLLLSLGSAPHAVSSWLVSPAAIRYHQRLSTRQYSTVGGYDNDDSEARSQFGTREYWDDMYSGMGDFSSEEYQWYFGWSDIKKYFTEYCCDSSMKILVPGMGNDPLLLDLVGAGYRDITAFDYSEGAVERQTELLSVDAAAKDSVSLHHMDVRALKSEWTDTFDAILEKGCLDALYLCGDGNIEKSAEELHRVLKPSGIFVSVSGVVPKQLRYEVFAKDKYDWLRDGSNDLKAGCFVWRKR